MIDKWELSNLAPLLAYNIKPWFQSIYECFDTLAEILSIIVIYDEYAGSVLFFQRITDNSWPWLYGLQKLISAGIISQGILPLSVPMWYLYKEDSSNCKEEHQTLSMGKRGRIIVPSPEHERQPTVRQETVMFFNGK